MNDGHCPKCRGLFMLLNDGNIQVWACKSCKKVVYRPYNINEIYQTFEEAQYASQNEKVAR